LFAEVLRDAAAAHKAFFDVYWEATTSYDETANVAGSEDRRGEAGRDCVADLLVVVTGRLVNAGWLSCLDRRVDWVALVSVVSSGVVAIATVLVSVFQRRGDRKHEKSLAFEEPIFERKTEALLAAIALLRPFVQVLAAH